MIEPTDEMRASITEPVDKVMRAAVHATYAPGYWDEARREAVERVLAAVLAIVERDQAGPCLEVLTRALGGVDLWCELRHGHGGDHESGATRWKHVKPASRWRCNTTERCFLEDGHDGPHGFAGVT